MWHQKMKSFKPALEEIFGIEKSPLVGDEVIFESSNQTDGYLLEILPRKMSWFDRQSQMWIKGWS